VGSDLWNTVANASEGPSQDGSSVSGVSNYGSIVSDIDSRMSSIIVTKSHVPDDATIAAARAAADQYSSQLDFVKSVIPEVAPQVAADQQNVQSMLPAPMTSPSAVGREAFEQELSDRAKALGQGILDWTQYLAWGLGAAAVIYVASQFSGKRSAA
jgi:hypothetical protein